MTSDNDPTFVARTRARKKVARELRYGNLTRKPCEMCGAADTHAHHDDYDRPLDVRWLCRIHHVEVHHGPAENRRKPKKYADPDPTVITQLRSLSDHIRIRQGEVRELEQTRAELIKEAIEDGRVRAVEAARATGLTRGRIHQILQSS